MDYNDIQSRLERIYSSINEQYFYGDDALKMVHSEMTNKHLAISFFNPEDRVKILNQINNIISNLANIKDCLKRKLEQRKDDPQVIENEINNSLYLQLILDLASQERHTYPLTKIRRSKKDPLIKNIDRVLTTSNKPDNIRHEKNDGSAIMNAMVVITADITDLQGNLLCHLDDLVKNTLSVWEQIIKKYNIT